MGKEVLKMANNKRRRVNDAINLLAECRKSLTQNDIAVLRCIADQAEEHKKTSGQMSEDNRDRLLDDMTLTDSESWAFRL